MRAYTRVRCVLALGAVAGMLAACNEGSLPDRNLPRDEALNREFSYPAYQTSPESAQVWELDGRRWQVAGAVETIDQALMRSVASAEGATVYALSADAAPYDRLYAPAGAGKWRVLTAID